MKRTLLNLFKGIFILLCVVSLVLNSCKKDDPEVKDPIASFQFEIDTINYLKVSFTNYSQNAATYSWDFGDGETSTEENPIHTYAAADSFTVKLTAINTAAISHEYSLDIVITDPNAALVLLTGGSSKTWKLYREGTSMGIGPDAITPRTWWSLENDGKRPCVYRQEWTFNHDGTFDFDDKGEMWGEGNVFEGTALYETCFPAVAGNMKNKNGADVSAWLGGSHTFSYNPTIGELTLTGLGAWIGLVKVTPSGDVLVPQSSVTYTATVEAKVGYDLLKISITGTGFYWDFTYASYDNPADEPDLVEAAAPWGVDLPNITPTAMFMTFASKGAADMATIDTITSGSNIVIGVTDPAGGATKVGQFNRTTETYQEQKFMAVPKSHKHLLELILKQILV